MRWRHERRQAPLQAGAASPSWCPSPGRCPPVAHILLIHVTESLECPEPSQGGLTMTRFLLSVVLGMSTALGLLLRCCLARPLSSRRPSRRRL